MNDEFVELDDPNAGVEPSDQEIEEYAEWLGADLQKDRDLFWIAKEALMAPIPDGWKLYQRKDGSGEPFYFNQKTGESLWDHPLDKHYKELFLAEKKKKMTGGGGTRPAASLGNKSSGGSGAKGLLSGGGSVAKDVAPMSLGSLKGTTTTTSRSSMPEPKQSLSKNNDAEIKRLEKEIENYKIELSNKTK